MVVRRKTKDEKANQLPRKLDEAVQGGMTASCLEKKFKEDKDSFRDTIQDYIENESFEIDISKAFKTEYGNVTLKSKENVKVDKDAIIELFNNGTLNIETIVNIASFSATNFEKVVSSTIFADSTSSNPTEHIELKPNAEFRKSVTDAFDSGATVETVEVEVEKPKAKAKPKAKKKPTLEESLARMKKIKAKKSSVDDDLNDILGE